jgi:hypothetical protein
MIAVVRIAEMVGVLALPGLLFAAVAWIAGRI